MKLFGYYSVINFSNCYILGREAKADALLIDPGIFDEGLLRLIEGEGLYVRHVLLTHAHHAHVNGIRTLLRIYDASLHCLDPDLLEFPAAGVREAEALELADFRIGVLETPGHSNDSVCYLVDRLLFTGDVLSAGAIGSAANGYERALLLSSIQKKLLALAAETYIFPGHGPPTTLEIEKRFNPQLKEVL